METIRQLSLSDISPDELAPGLEAERRDRSRERMYAAQKRYRQTERGKAKARNNVRAWRERQGAEYEIGIALGCETLCAKNSME